MEENLSMKFDENKHCGGLDAGHLGLPLQDGLSHSLWAPVACERGVVC
jgi:hypothetical protein